VFPPETGARHGVYRGNIEPDYPICNNGMPFFKEVRLHLGVLLEEDETGGEKNETSHGRRAGKDKDISENLVMLIMR
jgi:hypothetical protein